MAKNSVLPVVGLKSLPEYPFMQDIAGTREVYEHQREQRYVELTQHFIRMLRRSKELGRVTDSAVQKLAQLLAAQSLKSFEMGLDLGLGRSLEEAEEIPPIEEQIAALFGCNESMDFPPEIPAAGRQEQLVRASLAAKR